MAHLHCHQPLHAAVHRCVDEPGKSSSFDDLGRIAREGDGKIQGGREGREELTGGESSDELTRTKTEQIEEEEGVEVR
jgi:hypothetical protein